MIKFLEKQINDFKKRGITGLIHKIKILIHLILNVFLSLPFFILAIPFVFLLRIAEPFILIRIGRLISSRIGHFAGNTELYLCERDNKINTPNRKHIDLFYFAYYPICNKYLAKKIEKLLVIYPKIIMEPILILNKLIPGWEKFEIFQNTQWDRDVHNLLDKCKVHFKFTNEEQVKGSKEIIAIGIPPESKIVCLFVRDSTYLLQQLGRGYDYHNYRDCNINNYLKAAEELTKLGYYVVRMGAIVKDKIKSINPKIIDYASCGKRSEFLDIYLAYKCEFVISSSSGWDCVPSHLFRKPILFTNVVPIGLLLTFSDKFMLTTRKYFDTKNNVNLNFSEIYSKGYAFYTKNEEYLNSNLKLIENSPDEICDAVLDMIQFVSNKLRLTEYDLKLQKSFWNSFPVKAKDTYYKGNLLHGEIKAIMSPSFLRNNNTLIN
jgi:putative glycosyltransferase (TIGR04372 family)